MAERAIFKYAKRPERRQKPVYYAFELASERGSYMCRSVAQWPLSGEQLQAWADGADIEIRFIDHQAEVGT